MMRQEDINESRPATWLGIQSLQPILLLTRQSPSSHTGIEAISVRLQGPLDLSALLRAREEVKLELHICTPRPFLATRIPPWEAIHRQRAGSLVAHPARH